MTASLRLIENSKRKSSYKSASKVLIDDAVDFRVSFYEGKAGFNISQEFLTQSQRLAFISIISPFKILFGDIEQNDSPNHSNSGFFSSHPPNWRLPWDFSYGQLSVDLTQTFAIPARASIQDVTQYHPTNPPQAGFSPAYSNRKVGRTNSSSYVDIHYIGE